MAERGEELTRKIEDTIREAIERMVSDIRSSIDDVREAVNQQLDAASQSVQADAKSLSVRSHLSTILDEIEAPAPAAPPPPPRPADARKLRAAIRAVEVGKSQVEILNALLEQSRALGSRSALFILKADTFAGWKGAGFAAHGGNDEAIKRLSIPVADVPSLRRLHEQETVVATGGREITDRIDASPADQALLIPMVIKDKVAAALYVDVVPGAEADFDRSALELLTFMTGLLIDTLPIRKKIPSPTLSADEGDATVVMGIEQAEPEATRVAPTPPKAAPAPAAGARPMVMPQPAPPPKPPEETPQPARPAPSFELQAPPSQPVPVPPKPAAPPPAAPPSPAPARPAGEGERPSTQYVPPAGVSGGRFGAQQPQSPDAKKHDEAKRFARLLVSEIKLYNEAKVEEGRQNRDLYERMKEDVDRSRQLYEERIPEDVRRGSNYFYDELVRILADGNPDLLGL